MRMVGESVDLGDEYHGDQGGSGPAGDRVAETVRKGCAAPRRSGCRYLLKRITPPSGAAARQGDRPTLKTFAALLRGRCAPL